MRYKDANKMKEIQEFAELFYISEQRSPSTTEIANAVGLSRGTVYRYLVEMNDKQMISYDGKSIQSNKTLKYDIGQEGAPICGAIPCGAPMQEEENIEHIVSLPTQIFGRGPLYILKACGDSMEDVGINEGDYIVIRQTSQANVGDIVVALDNEGCNTLKTFAGKNRKNGKYILRYENYEKYGDKTIEVSELSVQGIAQHVIKAL